MDRLLKPSGSRLENDSYNRNTESPLSTGSGTMSKASRMGINSEEHASGNADRVWLLWKIASHFAVVEGMRMD